MTVFKKAPLPFMGQKRNFLNSFKEALITYSPEATYVDLFGGSGLLSHTVKNFYPNGKIRSVTVQPSQSACSKGE